MTPAGETTLRGPADRHPPHPRHRLHPGLGLRRGPGPGPDPGGRRGAGLGLCRRSDPPRARPRRRATARWTTAGRLRRAMSDLEAALEAIVRSATPGLMQVLTTARDLDLPDWLIFSGAIYQRVLNHLTGRASGLRDQGLRPRLLRRLGHLLRGRGRGDPAVAAAFEPPLRDLVEVRNQARVHLWFEDKFGEPYAPLTCTAEALDRFASAGLRRRRAAGGRRSADHRRALRPGGPVRPAPAAQSRCACRGLRPHRRERPAALAGDRREA